MRDSNGDGNDSKEHDALVRREAERDYGIRPGRLVDIHRAPHRILAVVQGRVLATGTLGHGAYLVQDPLDGTIQLPGIEAFRAMLAAGEAVWPKVEAKRATASERMRAQIRLLDALGTKQGDKAIWIALAAHWSPDLEARYGPHDEAWKIRRWRAALRRAAAEPADPDETAARGGPDRAVSAEESENEA